MSVRRIPRGLAVPGTAEGRSCYPREARFVCGMRIMLPSALRNQGNVTVLFSSQVHVLRDVPALKADNGRTFEVSDVQPAPLTAESGSFSTCCFSSYDTPEMRRTLTLIFSVQR